MKKIIIYCFLLGMTVPAICQQKQFLVTAYGAVPDGVIDNTAAIQKTIDAAAAIGGGKVVVPEGKYVTGVLHLKSGIELIIGENAVLLGSTNRNDYGPGQQASALILAENANNIAITGKGTINTRGDLLIADIYKKLKSGELKDNEWKDLGPGYQKRPAESNRPRILEFRNCDSVTVKNIHIQNGTGWIQNYKNCSHIIIDSITVLSNTYWNNDGIDLVDCKNAQVTNSFFNAADDGICLKSEDRNRYCENVLIANCKVRSSANAVKLGTSSNGGFKNIVIKNIEVYDTYRSAVAIESVDGGLLENIVVQDIHAVNTGNAFFIRLGHRNKDTVYSQLRNIYIGNMKVEVPGGKPDKGYPIEGPGLKYPVTYKPDPDKRYESVSPWNNSGIDRSAIPYPHNVFPSSITGLPGHTIENVVLENIEITYEGGADKTVNYFPSDSLDAITEAAGSYPEFSMFGELPCWGLYARHVKGLEIKNFTIKTKQPDFRSAGIFNEVEKLKLDGFSVNGQSGLPVLILKSVKNYSVNKLVLPGDKSKAIKVDQGTKR